MSGYRRRVTPNGEGSSKQLAHPRSANLEQLYHESLPSMSPNALCHSGPSVINSVAHFHVS